MATALVLKIEDDIVGPCLELIRKVCEPLSSSTPHITVRGPVLKLTNIPSEFVNPNIEDIDLLGPGAFISLGSKTAKNQTVFVECGSDQLDSLSYKPDYPESVFHVTLYDGSSIEFAQQLLKELRTYSWHFKVPLPKNTSLSVIQIRNQHKRHKPDHVEYDTRLKKLFSFIVNEQLDFNYLISLTDEHRLIIVKAICQFLHSKTKSFIKILPPDEKHLENGIETRRKLNPKKLSDNNIDFIPSFPFMQELPHERFKSLKEINPIGQYITPPELAQQIVRFVKSILGESNSLIHFGDPAVGTGTFYSAVRQNFESAQIGSAIGVEIDPQRAAVTHKKYSGKGLQVIIGDFLKTNELQTRNLILSNPPYVRHQHIPQEYKRWLGSRVAESLGVSIGGMSGLYMYFVLLCHQWMQEGAIAAWLIPTEFMETNYGFTLRNYLTTCVQLIRIHRFDPKHAQFENALVSSAVVVFRKCPPPKDNLVSLSYGGTLVKPLDMFKITSEELHLESKWTVPWRKRCKITSNTVQLGQLFIVRRGLATGANDYFIMKREEAKRNGIPTIALRPVLPKSRYLESDIIEKGEDGYPSISPQLCLLDCHLSLEQIRTEYPRLMDYLNTASRKVLDSYLVTRRTPWYRQESRAPAPFLCTYMGRGNASSPALRFIWNKSDAVATNVYLMLYPRNKLANLVKSQPALEADLFSFLNGLGSSLLCQYGRLYGGGLHKIEPAELLKVQLPSVPSWLLDVIEDESILIKNGARCISSSSTGKTTL